MRETLSLASVEGETMRTRLAGSVDDLRHGRPAEW